MVAEAVVLSLTVGSRMEYTAPPTAKSSTRTSQADYLPMIQADELRSGAPVAPAAGTVSSNRRRSSTKVPGLKRAFSTPNVRDHTIEEGMPLSPLDKKRNKLGYHRTAVACGTPPFSLVKHVDNTDDSRSLPQKENSVHNS